MPPAFSPQTWRRKSFLVSTDPTWLNIAVIHNYLAHESYWCPGISLNKVVRAISYSLCFGIYQETDDRMRQVGFGRVVTDFTSHAYLADIFVLPALQGQGLGKWLIACILAHPELQGLRRWTLDTRDAHRLYEQFGFERNPAPEKYMVYYPNKGEPLRET